MFVRNPAIPLSIFEIDGAREEVELVDGAVIGGGESAIECDGGEITISGTKIQGASMAIEGKNNLKLKALKKAAVVSTAGDALVLAANAQLTLNDASVEGARWAIKSTSNTSMKLGPGARVVSVERIGCVEKVWKMRAGWPLGEWPSFLQAAWPR